MAVRYAALCACRKSTYVTLAHKRKQKFFYFGCSLEDGSTVKKVNKNNKTTSANGTDGQTDGQTDRQSATQYAAPSYGGGPHNNTAFAAQTGHVRRFAHWARRTTKAIKPQAERPIANKLCGMPPQYAPPCDLDLLTLKVVSESRVT